MRLILALTCLLWSGVTAAQPVLTDQEVVEAALSGGQGLGAAHRCGIAQDRIMIAGALYIERVTAGRSDEAVRLLSTLLAVTVQTQPRPKDCGPWLRRFNALERELR